MIAGLHGEMSEWLKEHAWKACVLDLRPTFPSYPSNPRPHPFSEFIAGLKTK